jgi:AcrR family transcriptional regulator
VPDAVSLAPFGGAVTNRGQERRRHLLRVSARLIRERGFEALSVNELAGEAGISVGGLYRHIKTKADLLVLACDEIQAGMREHVLEAAAGGSTPGERLSAAIEAYWLYCYERSDIILLTYRDYRSLPQDAQARYKQHELELNQFFRDLIRSGVLVGEFQSRDDKALATQIIFLSHISAFKRWALRGSDPATLAKETAELFLTRLRADISPRATSGKETRRGRRS